MFNCKKELTMRQVNCLNKTNTIIMCLSTLVMTYIFILNMLKEEKDQYSSRVFNCKQASVHSNGQLSSLFVSELKWYQSVYMALAFSLLVTKIGRAHV